MSEFPARNDFRTPFYERYHKEAEDYDKEFVRKHDGDLSTTLIFVRRERSSMIVR